MPRVGNSGNGPGISSAQTEAGTTPASEGYRVLHWFRRGLRLHDNPALLDALHGAVSLRCVYILDPWFAGNSQASVNKWRFLIQCLEDLDTSLRKLNSRLYLVRGQPTEVLPKLISDWNINRLSFEEDPEPYGKDRDAAVCLLAREAGVSIVRRISHTLYDLQAIKHANGGTFPLTFRKFQTLVSSLGPSNRPCEAVTLNHVRNIALPVADDHDEYFGIPSLEELGFDTEHLKPGPWRGGETEALLRLERHLERKAYVASFATPKFNAQSLFANNQTGVSPYLTFGCLSPRLFYWRLTDLFKKVKKQNGEPPISLYGQLLWREFFYAIASENKYFDRMAKNPFCIQVPWDRNPRALAKWAEAKTGFPWIDAIMRQLREEGWIHALSRHSVACFLTRGHLFASWEEGQKVFAELMLDADYSCNAGNWLWQSGSSFFQQFFRTYCPVNFGKKIDPSGDFVKHYVPELKGYPSNYIYEPWRAPESVQKAARCIIGKDYPMPIVDHEKMSQFNFERLKKIYCRIFSNLQQVNRREQQRHQTGLINCSQITFILKRVFSSSSSDEQNNLGRKPRNHARNKHSQFMASMEEIYT